MQCWPRVNEATKECYRVLKSGGKIFASTVINLNDLIFNTTFTEDDSTGNIDTSTSSVNIMVLPSFLKFLPQQMLLKTVQFIFFQSKSDSKRRELSSGLQIFETVEVLEKLFTDAGFHNNTETGSMLTIRREGSQCVIIKATK